MATQLGHLALEVAHAFGEVQLAGARVVKLLPRVVFGTFQLLDAPLEKAIDNLELADSGLQGRILVLQAIERVRQLEEPVATV